MEDGKDTSATVEVVVEGSEHNQLRTHLTPVHRVDTEVEFLIVVAAAAVEVEIEVLAVVAGPKDNGQAGNVLLPSLPVLPMMDWHYPADLFGDWNTMEMQCLKVGHCDLRYVELLASLLGEQESGG